MGHECLILLKIFTLLYLSKEVRKHKDTNDFRDAYCGERVQSSKLIARFTAHIDFTICVVSAITLVITVIFSIRVCPMLCSLVATRCGVLVVSAPLKHSMHAVLASIINRNARAMPCCDAGAEFSTRRGHSVIPLILLSLSFSLSFSLLSLLSLPLSS